MKISDFQDQVLTHLGADAEWKKNICEELKGLKEQVAKTNGTVRSHQTWIDNANGKLALIGTAVVFGANILWQIIKDSITK